MTNGLEDVTVVIPTLNEEKAIGKVLDEVLALGIPRENVIIVDGYSTDRTREIAEEKGVRVILQEGKGKTDAVKTAINHIRTPITVLMDGDYTYPAKYIPILASKIREGYDLVIGRRIPQKDAQKPIFDLGNKLLSKTFNLLYGIRLKDVLSGMYAVRTSILRELLYVSKGFGIESEIVAHVASTGGKITEIPIEYRARIGEKKLGVKHGLHIFVDMLKLAWYYNPTLIIFSLGILFLLIPGLILIGYVGYEYLAHGVKYYVKGLIGVALASAGIISLMLTLQTIFLKRMEIRMTKHIRSLKEEKCSKA